MVVKRCNCPNINVEEWEGKEFDWEKKTFYYLRISNFMYKPQGLAEKIRQLKKEIVHKNYDFTDFTPIMCDWAAFKGRVMVQIKNPEKYDENIYIYDMGTIYSTVFQGPSKLFKQSVKDFQSKIELDYGIPPQDTLIWYAHCPACAKEKENLAVIFIKT